MAEVTGNLHEEIAQLEARLAAKKQEVLHSGSEIPEKELFKSVIKEHASLEVPQVVIPASSTSQAASSTRVATPADQQKIKALIATSFIKGIAAAIAEARKYNDAYFIDLLHDQLADEYYQKLLAARQLNAN
jgi:hypothetical protein